MVHVTFSLVHCFMLHITLSLVHCFILHVTFSLVHSFIVHVTFSLVHCFMVHRTQKLKSHLVRTQSYNVLPLQPGVGRYIAIHDTLTARDFFLANFYLSGPFTCIFSKPLPILPVLAIANTWFM